MTMRKDFFILSGEKENDEMGETEKIRQLEMALEIKEKEKNEEREYLSHWANQMRKPLHTILGFATIASEDMDNQEEVRKCLEQIITSSKEMADLIQEMMQRSKEGRMQPEDGKKQKRWDEIIQQFCEMVHPKLKEKHLTLKVDLREIEHMVIEVELFRLQQILWNLVENAMKYTNENGVIVLKVQEQKSEKEGQGMFQISVQDTGIGIQKDFLPHLYEQYAREDRTEVTEQEGQGIGLTAVKRMVDWMDGTIEVESIFNHGTTFVVTLPIAFGEVQ